VAAAPVVEQYGVFPVRSGSRLNHGQPSQINNSFDNISEISYSDYARTIDKSQQRNRLEAAMKQNLLVTNLNESSALQNQSMTRLTSLRSPRSLIGLGGINPRSTSASERKTSSRSEQSSEARHDYFRKDASENSR